MVTDWSLNIELLSKLKIISLRMIVNVWFSWPALHWPQTEFSQHILIFFLWVLKLYGSVYWIVCITLSFILSLKRAESKEKQSVGPHAAQQLSSSRCRALLHHHQPQPNGAWQEEDLPPVVRTMFIFICQTKGSVIWLMPPQKKGSWRDGKTKTIN